MSGPSIRRHPDGRVTVYVVARPHGDDWGEVADALADAWEDALAAAPPGYALHHASVRPDAKRNGRARGRRLHLTMTLEPEG